VNNVSSVHPASQYARLGRKSNFEPLPRRATRACKAES
jgi:hypothetical protein